LKFVLSLNSLSEEDILAIAHHATSSRVLDALLDSPTVPQKVKRQFVLSFIGRYHVLVDDRIGSRVGDRCWAFSDTYLKVGVDSTLFSCSVLIARLFQEKIARSLIPQEQFLAGSYYGKFFARNLNLYLLQRRPDEWRTMQSDRKRAAVPPAVAAPSPVQSAEETKKERKKRKRDAAGDEIDDLFGAALGKKVKKAALVDAVQPESKVLPSGKETALDRGLSDVMGAIRAAPGEGKGKRKR
jgi:nucleolar protein 9